MVLTLLAMSAPSARGDVATAAADAATTGEMLRIAVGRFRDPFVITGDVRVVSIAMAPIAAGRRVTLRAGSSGLIVDGLAKRDSIVRVLSADLLTLAGHHYRRELEVQWRLYDGRPELLVVHPLELETYVVGIVSSELPTGWPLAAYQAQAIAARTFALWQKYRRLDLPYHMEASVLDQVYGGVEREHALAIDATVSTRGLVMTYQHRVVQAYFHASCGDHTESARDGWGTALAYLPGSVCGACNAANRSRWSASIKRAAVDKALASVLGEPVTTLSIVARTATGRARFVEVVGAHHKKTITGADLRRLLGATKLWSTSIDRLEFDGDHLVVTGKGAGHGVGLCQWGARGRALKNDSYAQILQRYYPGVALTLVY